jgi:hypothetical protein
MLMHYYRFLNNYILTNSENFLKNYDNTHTIKKN